MEKYADSKFADFWQLITNSLNWPNILQNNAFSVTMRTTFEFRPTAAAPPLNWRELAPPGFAIRRIDSDIATRLDVDLKAALGYSWFNDVWGGIEGFIQGGFGFVAEFDGSDGLRLASNCRQWGSPDGIAPIQVSTRAVFRGRGLATLVSSAFIEECLRRGLTPEYSCESDNYASIALAAKLGFSASVTVT